MRKHWKAGAAAISILGSVLLMVAIHPLGANDISSICSVHGTKMKKRSVPILYGLPSREVMKEREAALALYPNAPKFVLGGCVVRWKRRARVYYCEDCAATRERAKQVEEKKTAIQNQ